MTVIEFGQKDIRINALYIVMGVLVVCSVFFSIVSYSRLSSLKHNTEKLEKDIAHEQVRNAELKTALSNRLAEFDAEEYLLAQGYVFEKNPKYSD
ncbi:hypothetical protein A2755_02805 [Candidatus Wolfebacteria bacterium RIFCSPHIGHO2_01_FULL_48_22]|uniref:Septum formation initiator n=2 Tax=Candidatus Wolfeibacteriota TaxID=1752735 RepID=A0A1F8DTZ6_9BACT|nr:MAG: hypothetical protein A2755_02805 [Candidatus Wolfebacteria bacterium RIFCSPHIGHO2_01_FULL_48_22]OGM92203.1 MAG: hypothetical protein A2935_00260 [Candidatus Wolfebacteria bacterium RIFCSPLOWO2_01_FULL_47_17b]